MSESDDISKIIIPSIKITCKLQNCDKCLKQINIGDAKFKSCIHCYHHKMNEYYKQQRKDKKIHTIYKKLIDEGIFEKLLKYHYSLI